MDEANIIYILFSLSILAMSSATPNSIPSLYHPPLVFQSHLHISPVS